MAATVKTRIQLKCDTEANWSKARNFCPMRGEVIIYSADDFTPFCRLKVGDGSTPVVDLPFVPYEGGGGGSAVTTTHTTQWWREHPTYIPQNGEIVVYSDYSQNIPALKVGDGTTYVADLPFIDDLIQQHMNNAEMHVSAQDRIFWNNKLNYEDEIILENLILTRG